MNWLAWMQVNGEVDKHPFFHGFMDSIWDSTDFLLMIFCWFSLICTFIVVQKIARNALAYFKQWHKERLHYKLPKPPDTYRLN